MATHTHTMNFRPATTSYGGAAAVPSGGVDTGSSPSEPGPA